jgi:hypothetical protein
VDAVLVTTAGVLLPVAAAWAMALAVRRRWPAGWLTEPLEHHPRERPAPTPEDDGEDEGDSGVREPRRPLPSTGGAAAHAEPDERAA